VTVNDGAAQADAGTTNANAATHTVNTATAHAASLAGKAPALWVSDRVDPIASNSFTSLVVLAAELSRLMLMTTLPVDARS
jgi:hypothetical protein